MAKEVVVSAPFEIAAASSVLPLLGLGGLFLVRPKLGHLSASFASRSSSVISLGIEKTAMIRVRSGISYALTEGMDEGHCGLPTDELVPLAERLLEVPQQLIRTALDLELRDGTVIADRVGNALRIS